MKKITKMIRLLAVFTLILPLAAFPSFAEISGVRTMAGKYSSKTGMLIAPDNVIKETGFSFTETEYGRIEVITPDWETFSGVSPVSALTFDKEAALDGLTVTLCPDDFGFSMGGYLYSINREL